MDQNQTALYTKRNSYIYLLLANGLLLSQTCASKDRDKSRKCPTDTDRCMYNVHVHVYDRTRAFSFGIHIIPFVLSKLRFDITAF